jgi:peptide/nickel transport system permease protein
MKSMEKVSAIDRISNRIAWIILGLFAVVALLAPVIASDVPFYATRNDKTYWPLFSARHWTGNISDYDRVIFPPVAFKGQGEPKLEERLQPPGTISREGPYVKVHRLGTDRLGRDVAAGLISGCRKSIWIAFLAMAVSAIAGTLLGASAGYWNNHLPLPWAWKIALAGLIVLYAVYLWYFHLINGWMFFLIGMVILFIVTAGLGRNQKRISFPLDTVILKLIEIFQSIPALLLLMVITALVDSPGLLTLALLISLIRWASFARFTRAEVIKINARDYITAARVSGLGTMKILTRYIMPEAFGPLVVIFAFGISSVILLESTLSFLGIGLPVEEVTWGTMLSQARRYSSAWWLAVFPGLCILLLVFSLNLIGSQLKERFVPQD